MNFKYFELSGTDVANISNAVSINVDAITHMFECDFYGEITTVIHVASGREIMVKGSLV
jgi:hypothetical protein